MKISFNPGRYLYLLFHRIFRLHPSVGDLVQTSLKLSNPYKSAFPAENLAFVSRIMAQGLWNYSFFQFYRGFSGPYWVERQYNPADPSFIPRAGLGLSVNITHRTWHGFRSFSGDSFALTDPAGSLSPVPGGYSIETGVIENGALLLPTRSQLKKRQYLLEDSPFPVTELASDTLRYSFISGARGNLVLSSVVCRPLTGIKKPPELVISVRPFSPEGAAPIRSIRTEISDNKLIVIINEQPEIVFHSVPDRISLSDLKNGDAYWAERNTNESFCSYGVCTAAFFWTVTSDTAISFSALTGPPGSSLAHYSKPTQHAELPELIKETGNYFLTPQFRVRRKNNSRKKHASGIHDPLHLEDPSFASPDTGGFLKEIINEADLWKDDLNHASRFRSARPLWNRAAAVMTQHLRSLQTGNTVIPGVFTYSQFWFRDAAYMLNALQSWNYLKETESVLHQYPSLQERDGFFRSHEGEWDSAGQALWSLVNYAEISGNHDFLNNVYKSVKKGAGWIIRNRTRGYRSMLLPSGFSAEHLGPADYYYWDNFWCLAGLRAASLAAEKTGNIKDAEYFKKEAELYAADIRQVSEPDRKRTGVIPAAPGRLPDAGIIGNIAELYPLDLHLFSDQEMLSTLDLLYDNYFNRNLFYHPVIHSGYNIYLSLQAAHAFLILGKASAARRILKAVISARTDFWTYPEAIHPLTGGGAMGDGYHGWAYAELLMLLRSFVFIRRGAHLDIFRGMNGGDLFTEDLQFGPFPLNGTALSIYGSLSESSGKLHITLPDIKKTGIKTIRLFLPQTDPRSDLKIKGASSAESFRREEKSIQSALLTGLQETITVTY